MKVMICVAHPIRSLLRSGTSHCIIWQASIPDMATCMLKYCLLSNCYIGEQQCRFARQAAKDLVLAMVQPCSRHTVLHLASSCWVWRWLMLQLRSSVHSATDIAVKTVFTAAFSHYLHPGAALYAAAKAAPPVTRVTNQQKEEC